MRVNVSALYVVSISYAHANYLGPRDSQGHWQDRPGGSDGSAAGDEELYVKLILEPIGAHSRRSPVLTEDHENGANSPRDNLKKEEL